MKYRTGIFGGSFDPVHKGHVEAAKSFLISGLIDDLLIIPTPYPPHKKDIKQTAFHHRVNMLDLAFKKLAGIHISDLEKNLPSPSYTLQTLRHLHKKNPDTIYFLCLGEDSLAAFHTWYKYDEILADTTLIVAERPGFDSSEISNQILEKTIFIDHKTVDASSSKIRDSDTITAHLSQEVYDYIKKHSLYSEETGN